jgi:recombinational DNA repair ATPase RecF
MHHLSNIDISNFRGINQTVSPVPLSELTVLIGRNGTGKSSVLEALYSFIGGEDPITNQHRINRVTEKHSGGTTAHKYTGKSEINAEIGGAQIETTLSDRIESVHFQGEDHGEMLPVSALNNSDNNSVNDVLNLYFAPEQSYSENIRSLSAFKDDIVDRGSHVDVALFLSDYSSANF